MSNDSACSNSVMGLSVRKLELPHWLAIWLLIGVAWFLVAVAWMPTNKLYQQGLVAFLWLPALLTVFVRPAFCIELVRANKFLMLTFAGLFVWSSISLLIAEPSLFLKELKRQLYVGFFLLGVAAFVRHNERLAYQTLIFAALLLALAAVVSTVDFYVLQGYPLRLRLQGIGQLSHPILGGYVIGLVAAWLACGRVNLWVRLLALVVLLVFMLLTQSRGVWLAFLAVCVLMPLWQSSRRGWLPLVLLVLAGAPLFFVFIDVVLARGFSYRPEIWVKSLDMISLAPVWGVGFAADYHIVGGGGKVFDHSHNLLLHVAIMSGIPAVLMWLTIWAGVAWQGWRHRKTPLGSLLCASVVFSSVACLFDASSLWGTPRPEWFLTWLPLGIALGLGRTSVPAAVSQT
ncbi:O-antigen ligase family protein [Pseudomonas jilinensis]|nr:O-antigen ligase family protein [Pseudomonas jilinensis]